MSSHESDADRKADEAVRDFEETHSVSLDGPTKKHIRAMWLSAYFQGRTDALCEALLNVSRATTDQMRAKRDRAERDKKNLRGPAKTGRGRA